MRSVFLTLFLLSTALLKAQLIDHLSIQLGPKMEFFHNNSQAVRLQTQLDASFSLFAIKELEKNWELKLGLIKRDYTAKFSVEVFEPATEQLELYFDNTAFPAYTSYQIFLGAQYSSFIDQNTQWYACGGISVYAHKKLNRTGLDSQTDYIYDKDQNPISSLEMRSFGNSFQEGNYMFRLESGILRAVNSYLALDASFYANASSLTHQAISLEFVDSQGSLLVKDQLRSQGIGIGLNFGVRISLNNSKRE